LKTKLMGDKVRDIKTLYDEVCRRHDGIAEFRGKLLTLLPIASGAGIFLLLAKDSVTPSVLPHLLPIGTFGVLVTLGLFGYELRGIQECNALIRAAKKLEKELLPELSDFGPFKFRPNPLFGVGATGAALLIYPAVTGAWVYVAAVGWVATLDQRPQVAVSALVAGLVALALGLALIRRQEKQLNNSVKRACKASKDRKSRTDAATGTKTSPLE
jgi:hypothetical protein